VIQPASISEGNLWLMVAVAYLIGSIPFGFILVQLKSGRDIREIGSGNIGATNVARAAGWSIGLATLALDAGKGFLVVWLIEHIAGPQIRFMTYAGLAAVLGHLYPVWLGFSGGKGVATALGVFLKICWPAVTVAVVLFILVAGFWRYVSLASVSAAACLPLLVYLLYAPGHAPPLALSTGTLLAAALVIMKHRENLERLVAGTEPRLELRRKKSE
jgi:glycerol-3-phosphate acyltransferase PlsY